MEKPAAPLKMKPAYKDYIWGGVTLKEKWGKISDLPRIAESWELSAIAGSESTVRGGVFDGKTICELLALFPDLAGTDTAKPFPLLVKLIDAAGDLSVQVHPDDSFALQHENQLGKTELWYIADAKEDAAIFYGFSRDVEENEIREAIFNKTLSSLLNRIPVKKGDAFFVPAGTVHAILKGVTVIEIQQSSSVTYRLYDYGRKDAQGKERELHVEKALQVVNMKKSLPPSSGTARTECGNTVRLLASCPYFISEEIKTERQAEFENNDGMITLTVSEGEGQFDNGAKAEKGDTFLIPCGVKTFLKGKLTVIKTILHI